MVFQDLLEFAKKHSIAENSAKIQEMINDNQEFCDESLKFIENNVFLFADYSFKTQFFNYLFFNKHFEHIYNIYAKCCSGNFEYELAKVYVDTLFEMGRLADFEKMLRLIFEELISFKYYSCLNDFIKKYEKTLKCKNYYILGKITFLLEIQDMKALSSELKKIRKDYWNGKNNLLLLKKIYSIIAIEDIDCCNFFKEKLWFKMLVASGDNIDFLLKEQCDAILFAEDQEDFLLVATILNDADCDEFLRFIKKNKGVSLRHFSYFLKDSKIKLKFQEGVVPKVIPLKTNEDESLLDFDVHTSEVVVEEFDYKPIYVESDDEITILNFFKLAKDNRFYTEAMVITFMNLRFYKLGKFLVSKIPTSSNQYYLDAMISLKLSQFSEVVDLVNSAITKFRIPNEEMIPFIVLKAIAFKKLGDEAQYQKLTSQIKYINPSFILTKDMWQM